MEDQGMRNIGMNRGVAAMSRGVFVTFLLILSLSVAVRAKSITVDGTGNREGLLPIHITAFTESTGSDVYPLGSGAIYLFSIFDTDSDIVVINDLLPEIFENPQGKLEARNLHRLTGMNFGTFRGTFPYFGQSDRQRLGLSTDRTSPLITVRMNGLNALNGELLAPLGPPDGEFAAQVAGPHLTVGPRELEITLIGTPVANKVVVLIDYTKTVTVGPYDGTVGSAFDFGNIRDLKDRFDSVVGPDMTFFFPAAPEVPVPDVDLGLQRSPHTPAMKGPTKGDLYLLRNVTFENNDFSADDRAFKFLYDTGTTLTVINDKIAAALGLSGVNGSSDCFKGKENQHTIDSVRMTDKSVVDAYTISNASICIKTDAITTTDQDDLVDAIIGSNLFNQVQVLFNGPENILGILSPAPKSDLKPPSGLTVIVV
jgi:hypothetical protein